MCKQGSARAFFSGLVVLAVAGAVGLAVPQRARAQRFFDGHDHDRGRHDQVRNWHSGAVYVLTDQSGGNRVIVYQRANDGTLSLSGSFPTGGKGMGTGADPLASEGALVLGSGDRLLFAVNAGSNDISEFAVRGLGLRLLAKVPSGGAIPVSIAVDGGLVYVLNAGGTPNVAGFVLSPFSNRLIPLPHSTQSLPGGKASAPAEIQFSPDGGVLAVSEKGTNKIDTFTVGSDGYLSSPQVTASSGATPFGFTFVRRNILLVSEAGPNALSSYRSNWNGGLVIITPSLPNGQNATCWVVATPGGRYAYTANAGTNNISSYAVSWDGDLSLLDPAAGATAAGSTPTDLALSSGGRFLYVRDGGNGTVSAFRIEDDGSLTPLGAVGGLPATTQGIAAR
ncbi:MAG TPA: beta-propeller fold lactonase family protein [Bryobacteraceae bacterium]